MLPGVTPAGGIPTLPAIGTAGSGRAIASTANGTYVSGATTYTPGSSVIIAGGYPATAPGGTLTTGGIGGTRAVIAGAGASTITSPGGSVIIAGGTPAASTTIPGGAVPVTSVPGGFYYGSSVIISH